MTSLLQLSISKTVIPSMAFSPQVYKETPFGSSFSTPYSGFILITISGNFVPSDVEVGINNTLTSVNSPWTWETSWWLVEASPYTVLIPVAPGSVTTYIWTNETGISPNLTVTYYS